MKQTLLWTLLVWGWSTFVALAQLTVTSPQTRIVYQRNQANRGTVWVSGQAPSNASRVEARLIPITGGSQTDWTSINIISPNKAFSGTLSGQGGWYRLEVRALSGGSEVASSTVDRVGIGEVFIVSGQSNAYGNDGSTGAADDRVSCIDFKDDNLNEQLLPVAFSHVDFGRNIGPSNPLFIWGVLGDKLASRLNVPIMFLGAAQPATSSEQWRQSAEGAADYAQTLLPYRRLGVSLLHYASRTGLRAVLWHQGEGDVGNSPQRYFDNIQFIINKSRQQANYGALAWVVARVSYVQGRTDGNIINAQNRLISDVPNVYAGPNTDQLTGSDNRPDDVHFNGAGLPRLTDLWEQSLNGDFFSRSSPMSPDGDRPAITTGYILPANHNAGETVYVPYVKSGPFEGSNQFTAQLLSPDGNVVATLGSGNGNPLSGTLPGNLAPGSYRARVVSTQPAFTGTPSDVFQVNSGPANTTPPSQPIQPAVNGGTVDASIRQIGYKYDANSHGFQLLINATGPVEVRLERLDGGFGETGWGATSSSNDYNGFNSYRFYAPATIGVGGVEGGRYRLSVRKQGDGGSGQWTEVTLLNGKFTVYSAGDNVQPTPPSPPANPTPTPTEPTTPPVVTGSTDAAIRKIGYKYDAVSHGFQLLADATGPVEMKLERLDGHFSQTGWGGAVGSTDYTGYNYYRFYGPLSVGVGGVEAGRYRLSVRKAGSSGDGTSVEVTLQNGIFVVFAADGNTTQPTQPTTPTGSADAVVRKIGYKYDMPTHGFQLLADATGPVEMKLERLDGSFGDTNWGAAVSSGAYNGYSSYRYYAPASVNSSGIGTGGVEPGRYRLSVRKAGDSGNGTSVDVTLQNGVFVALGADNTTPAQSSSNQPTQPVNSNPNDGTIRKIGYKYDMPTHGFQLLADAGNPVEMKLERLDGPFGETNWGAAMNSTAYDGYNSYRFYAPASVNSSGIGTGGVEPGRYRLSVRRVGDTGDGFSAEVTLQNGIFSVYTHSGRVGVPEEELTERSWRVWPNPFVNEVMVSMPVDVSLKRLRVFLLSAQGNGREIPVQHLRLEQGVLRVQLESATEEYYLLQILDGNRHLRTLKLVKLL